MWFALFCRHVAASSSTNSKRNNISNGNWHMGLAITGCSGIHGREHV